MYRKAVVRAILRQDVAWFDVSSPQEFVTRMTDAVDNIYNGLKGSNYLFFQSIALTTTGFCVAFGFSWDVALVMLAFVPVTAFATVVVASRVMTRAKRREVAYAECGGIATETIYAMRTVAAFGLEPDFGGKFEKALAPAVESDLAEGPKLGVAMGFLFASSLLLQMVGFLYGGEKVAHEARASEFEYTSTSPNGMTVTHCADEANIFVSTTRAVTGCPAGTSPWLMSCVLADAVDQ
eukprot:5627000-Prymnesium_polylepis.1